MFKLMKYETRKNILGVIILLSVIMGFECYFLISAFAGSGVNTVVSALLLLLVAFVSYFCVFIFGITTYSKELKSKSGYMTFMTPISSFTVIGSKLLVTLLEGIFFAILLVALACINMGIIEAQFPMVKIFTDFVEMFASLIEINVGQIVLGFFATVLDLVINYIAIVSMAYLAITLSSTIFQNRKFKGIVSTIIFIIFLIIVRKIGGLLPNGEDANDMTGVFVAMIPTLLFYIAVAVGSIFASGTLLDKKVSL